MSDYHPNIWGGWDGKLILLTNNVLPKNCFVQFVNSGNGSAFIAETSGAIGNIAGRANKELKVGDVIAKTDIEWFNDYAKSIFVGAIIEEDTATYIKSEK